MAEKWWSVRAVMRYVALNYHPCDSNADAYRLIDRKVEDGTFRVQLRLGKGDPREIKSTEWLRPHRRRSEDLLGALNALEWQGWNALTDEERLTAEFEIETTAVENLCAPAPRRGDGRPPREIVSKLLVLAGMWLDEHGVPVPGSGEQAALERFLADEAGNQIKSESRIREIAVQAIGLAAAYRKAGI
ncbi:MAG TPA: hypothetical protein VGF29_17565 [Hyphomicrobiaceae bacterium]|jgi:hypothetical protein